MRIARDLKTSVAVPTQRYTNLAEAMRAVAAATNANDAAKARNLRRSRALSTR